jgi:hypothetical protein
VHALRAGRSDQNLQVDASLVPLADGVSKLHLSFRWSVSRTGYLSLFPFAVLAYAMWAWSPFAFAAIVVGYLSLHVPRDVQGRRLELISKLSDAFGSHIVDERDGEPYR